MDNQSEKLVIPYNETTALAYETITNIILRMSREADKAISAYINSNYTGSLVEPNGRGKIVTQGNINILIYFDFEKGVVKQELIGLKTAS